jgi:hypothetical protein
MVGGLRGEANNLMRQRYLVVTKLFDVLSRGLFVLTCTYGLPLEEAGRFGLLITIITLISFALGFERYIDIQRQVAGRSSSAIRRRMVDTFRFFRAHYLLLLPFAALGAASAGVSIWVFVLVTIVIVGEHISNQGYQIVLLDRRALSLLVASAAKNTLQLAIVLPLFFTPYKPLTYLPILQIWSVISVCYLVVAVLWWQIWMKEDMSAAGDELPNQSVVEQYRASLTHFLIGVVAVAALQVDRLIVSGVLVATDIGVYFRNVALAGVALQIFNIVSFNRVAPRVYRCAREDAWKEARDLVRLEYGCFALALAGFVMATLLVDYYFDHPGRQYGLEAIFVLAITLGILLRTAADYKGLLLLSLGGDQALFRNQVAALLLGSTGLLILAWRFQLLGAFCGAVVTHFFYFVFNHFSVVKIHSRLKATLS